ncbi:unnamed protein product [Sphagnum tenellum]
MKIISFVGFADAGKSTAASILAAQGYVTMSFADALKDCLSAIFGWRRDLLEGIIPESRVFRETVDQWWSDKLGIPDFTPRYAMKNFGTEVMRHHFHPDIWVMAVERRMLDLDTNQGIVFGDVRHPPEIRLTRSHGGKLVRIKKGDDPIWFDTARLANTGDGEALRIMRDVHNVHDSEMAWIGEHLDYTVVNDGSISDLADKIRTLNL